VSEHFFIITQQKKMLLLFASFSISLGIYFLIEKTRELTESAKKLHQQDAITSFADCYLEAVNLNIRSLTWLSTFFKVYLIGVVETIYITLCKRGLLKSSTTHAFNKEHVDTLVSEYNNNEALQQLAVITGGDSGIGLEISRALLNAGFHVIIGRY
jgi:hypothetical protein